MKKIVFLLILLTLLLTQNCSNYEYFPDMHYSFAVKSQQHDELGNRNGTFTIPANTIAYKSSVYSLKNDPEDYNKAESLKNPYLNTANLLELGKSKYNAYCSHCHGLSGYGDGPVKAKWSGILPIVKSTTSTKEVPAMNWAEGRIYHVIRVGIRSMASHASQMREIDMWAVAHYVKNLQKNGGAK